MESVAGCLTAVIMKLNLNSQTAFTLIELLVVISIIGILAGAAIVASTGSQKQARDVQRKSDLKQYQAAISSFASKNGSFYPAYNQAGIKAAGELCTTLGMSSCPEDPRASQSSNIYHYMSNSGFDDGRAKATMYVLWATLESYAGANQFWVVCSEGRSGAAEYEPDGGACPI